VVIESRAIALAGGTGVGKSTLALNMHLDGAGFLTDDVLALETEGGALIAHPGLPTAKLRQTARDLVATGEESTPGALVDENEHEVRYEVVERAEPATLGAVCLLEPADEGGALEIFDEPANPWSLLGSTFNLLVRDEERLRRQLDACTQIAESACYARARIPARPDAEVAAKLADHLRSLLGSSRL
jgi:hypothetical protein